MTATVRETTSSRKPLPIPERSRELMELANARVVLFDGGMGTQIFDSGVPPEQWAVPHCTESLVRSHPDVIRAIHRRYFDAGADVVETDTFNGNAIDMAEFGLDAREINVLAARLAREAAADAERKDGRRRFVSGSIGPGRKLASLGDVSFDALDASYHAQVRGLIEGGADVLQIETQNDPLTTKAAIHAARRAFDDAGARLPIIAQFTVEKDLNTLLTGTEVLAAYCAIEPFEEVWAVGLNCATGPVFMAPFVRQLCESTHRVVTCLPNAGLPTRQGDRTVFPEEPGPFAEQVASFVRELGVGIVGGCCGTTPDHIRALAKLVAGQKPRARTPRWEPAVASLFTAVPLVQTPPPLIVGERLNTQGSKKFKEIIGREDWDAAIAMGRDQLKEGAHVLDVQLAFVGRDEVRDARELFSRLVKVSKPPLAIDTTEYDVLECALKLTSGRAIVNSINLEAGEEKLVKKVRLAKRFGAACVALLIDEKGQATTFDWKMDCARRIHAIAVREGLRAEDLIFDALTFPITTGQEETRRAAIETLNAIRAIKRELPRVKTILGVSNVSFGIDPEARSALNSVFLHYAIEAGLDSAIVHASKIQPLYKLDADVRETCRRVVFDEREEQTDRPGKPGRGDPLQDLLALFAARGPKKKESAAKKDESIEDCLKRRIIDGDRPGLEKDLDRALEKYPPLAVVNDILLDGMKTVGELFGRGEMQLPFVLQSAEVMKAAVKYLEPKMEKSAGTTKGAVVLATVRGDVHDIGKNLVDIILSNNGYATRNLGIKVELDPMLAAAKEAGACAIGMSGLLVKSTVVMKENLEELNRRGLKPDVILGGAALTRRYVEEDLRAIYRGRVFYAKDAFEGLRLAEALVSGRDPEEIARESRGDRAVAKPGCGPAMPARREIDDGVEDPPAKAGGGIEVATKPVEKIDPPRAPFYGVRVIEDPVPLRELFSWINTTALFRGQWQFRRGKRSREDQLRLEKELIGPIFERTCQEAIDSGALAPKVVYGYFACRRDGDSLIVYDDEHGRREKLRFAFPRARPEKGGRCIADFFRDDVLDVLAVQLVTMGERATARAKQLFEADDYARYLYFHGLSVESAEALAEFWHARVRRELAIDARDSSDRAALFRMQYRGARYSFGYPACPSLEDQAKIMALLPARAIGVELTEEFELVPEQSTSAIVCHHPQARYFAV